MSGIESRVPVGPPNGTPRSSRWDFTVDQQLRLRAIELAVHVQTRGPGRAAADGVIGDADRFYAWLTRTDQKR